MKKESIRAHLAPYSIFQKRKTTINHAFASAIAPAAAACEVLKLEEAIRSLGQDPDGDLKCVYCGGDAHTWDHLVGLVAKAKFRGTGHQIGNLVPCCRACNSSKGSKDWEIYLQSVTSESAFHDRRKAIADYASKYAVVVDAEGAEKLRPAEWKRYDAIREEIFSLMKEADGIAKELRTAVLAHKEQRKGILVND
jgi:hypothetical protein